MRLPYVLDVDPQVFPGWLVLDRPGDLTGHDGGLEPFDVLRPVVDLGRRIGRRLAVPRSATTRAGTARSSSAAADDPAEASGSISGGAVDSTA